MTSKAKCNEGRTSENTAPMYAVINYTIYAGRRAHRHAGTRARGLTGARLHTARLMCEQTLVRAGTRPQWRRHTGTHALGLGEEEMSFRGELCMKVWRKSNLHYE